MKWRLSWPYQAMRTDWSLLSAMGGGVVIKRITIQVWHHFAPGRTRKWPFPEGYDIIYIRDDVTRGLTPSCPQQYNVPFIFQCLWFCLGNVWSHAHNVRVCKYIFKNPTSSGGKVTYLPGIMMLFVAEIVSGRGFALASLCQGHN